MGSKYDLEVIFGVLFICSKYISCRLKNPANLEPSEYDIEKPHLWSIQVELGTKLHLSDWHCIILESLFNSYCLFKCFPHDLHLLHGDVVVGLPVSNIYV